MPVASVCVPLLATLCRAVAARLRSHASRPASDLHPSSRSYAPVVIVAAADREIRVRVPVVDRPQRHRRHLQLRWPGRSWKWCRPLWPQTRSWGSARSSTRWSTLAPFTGFIEGASAVFHLSNLDTSAGAASATTGTGGADVGSMAAKRSPNDSGEGSWVRGMVRAGLCQQPSLPTRLPHWRERKRRDQDAAGEVSAVICRDKM
jgi:hypothetical protein